LTIKRNEEILEGLKADKLMGTKIKIKLATKYNRKEQQQDGKSNAELETKWTNTT
jgi:hypothetical protein